jgi:hypothetical protein
VDTRVGLPTSFFLHKLQQDYNDVLYDPMQITEQDWNVTFQYVYNLECKKATIHVLDKKDDIFNHPEGIFSIQVQLLIQKYPSLLHLQVGDGWIIQDEPKTFYIIHQQNDKEWVYEFLQNSRCSIVFIDVELIFAIPLKYWSHINCLSNVSLYCISNFTIPLTAQKYNLNQGMLLSAWVFIHKHVSFAIILPATNISIPVEIIYPCLEVLPESASWETFLKTHHLTNDRICVYQPLFDRLVCRHTTIFVDTNV